MTNDFIEVPWNVMDIYSNDVKLPPLPAAVNWCKVLHEKQVDRTLWKKKITICDCLALVPCRKFQAEELDWVQRNTCEPHVAQPRSPTKEILCLLDHRACPRAACCPQGCFLLRLSQVSEAPSPSGPLPQPPVWERRKRYILKEPKPFHREGHTTLTWEPSPNSRSPP